MQERPSSASRCTEAGAGTNAPPIRSSGGRHSVIGCFPTPPMRGFDGYKLEITFDDGVVRVVDCSFLLHGTLGEPLKDLDYFRQVRVDHDARTIAWPNRLDPAPELLHGGQESIDALNRQRTAAYTLWRSPSTPLPVTLMPLLACAKCCGGQHLELGATAIWPLDRRVQGGRLSCGCSGVAGKRQAVPAQQREARPPGTKSRPPRAPGATRRGRGARSR
jgi:Protein of unknown function (DUF2442)